MHTISRVIGQQPDMGALPTLQAAIDPDVGRNDYYGPAGFMEMRGYPKKVDTSAEAQDPELAKRLWDVSEMLTGIQYAWPLKVG